MKETRLSKKPPTDSTEQSPDSVSNESSQGDSFRTTMNVSDPKASSYERKNKGKCYQGFGCIHQFV